MVGGSVTTATYGVTYPTESLLGCRSPLNKLAFESEVMSLGRGSWRNLSTEG